MKVSLIFRHVKPSDALKRYARNKMEKLEKFSSRPLMAKLVLSREGILNVASATVRLNGFTVSGEEKAGDPYSSIDLIISKLDSQVRRQKEKATTQLHRLATGLRREEKLLSSADQREIV